MATSLLKRIQCATTDIFHRCQSFWWSIQNS